MTLLQRRLGRATRLPFCDQRGFALVLVIAVLGVLALLAAAIAAETRSTALGARSRLEIVAARNFADSGLTIAIMHLLDRNNASGWQADGAVHEERYGEATLRISIEDEGGKIDLNNAPKELLGGFLSEFVSAEQSSAMADAILNRRTASTSQSTARYFVGGSASFQTLALLPFSDISELRSIPGMSAALYEQVLPYVTVYSRSPLLNRQTASRVALLAIPSITPGDVDALIASRGAAEQIAPAQLSALARYTRIANVQSATIVVEARVPGGVSFTRQAVVAISPNQPLQPPRFLRWRQQLASGAATESD